MKKLVWGILGLFLLLSVNMFGQSKLTTKTGEVTFYSDAPMEKIQATTKKAMSAIEVATGKIEFAVLVNGFVFEKALMQEHFNENYMESTKYPKATFKGNITNIKDINFAKDGTYKANVSGNLTIHNVTKPAATVATITVKGGKVMATSTFNIKLEDYKVEIPALVKDKIAKEVKIVVNTNYEASK